ncbi:MAG: 16S rRNA (cytosine(1402)-N(4))-methyltransferase RsmH [Thermoanaerobaculales bacterium]|nr:16S rRNA (cytosine(1402)-N(4))-methyltransferase RsmH [Thermoanaerobaculales bacterium]
MPSAHIPVLTEQVVCWLAPAAPGLLVDATLGLGGHAAALLDAAPDFRLLGVDRDPHAVAEARRRLEPYGRRTTVVNASFDRLPEILAEQGLPQPAAILADLGCSSLQLDTPERGFSFAADGPLDMRMGAEGRTAADLVNTADEEQLVTIFWRYGEERRSRAVARALVRRRRQRPVQTTGDLSRLVESVIPRRRGQKIHPATRVFQALRIAVNDELGQLERFIEPAVRSLRPKGRMAVISFHSLEDRIVKQTFVRLEGRCTCPPDFPECRCDPEEVATILTRSPVRPTDDEIGDNPRSRSSRMRVVERNEGS